VSCRFTTGLNRALADAGLGELRRQFGYKTTWYGSKLLVVGRLYPSSKTCFSCGAVKAKLALHERTYHCDACGLAIDRNRNAAINLARLSEHAIGVKSRPAGSGPVEGRGASQKTPPGGGRRQRNANPAPAHAGQDRDRPSARRGCLTMSTHLRSRDGNGSRITSPGLPVHKAGPVTGFRKYPRRG
jgi:putative transposase